MKILALQVLKTQVHICGILLYLTYSGSAIIKIIIPL